MFPLPVSEVDRAVQKATTLWAIVITRTIFRDTYRQAGERHRVIKDTVDEIEWCLNEEQADRRVAELRRCRPKHAITIRKHEMRFAQRLEGGKAHELCEAMSVAWAERAAMTKESP